VFLKYYLNFSNCNIQWFQSLQFLAETILTEAFLTRSSHFKQLLLSMGIGKGAGNLAPFHFEIWHFSTKVSAKRLFSWFRVGKMKFHFCHYLEKSFWLPLEKSFWLPLEKSTLGPLEKILPTPMPLRSQKTCSCSSDAPES